MAGILANSIDVYMEEADTSTPNEEDGFVKDVEISFAIDHPVAQTSWVWDVTRPEDAEAVLVVADDYMTARLRPDLGGAWGVTCFVNDTTLYSLILNVLDEGATTPVHGQRLVRRHPDNVLRPRTGLVMFQSSTTGYESVKNSAGQVRQLGGGSSGVPIANIAAIAADDLSIYQDGTLFWLDTLRCHAVLYTTDEAPVSMESWQVTVGAGENARLLYRCDAPPGIWSDLTTVYINPSTGDDEATGDAAHPFETFPEVCRRFRGWEIAATVTVYPMADGVELVGQIDCAAEAQIIVDGQTGIDADPARTLATGTVATFTQYSEITNEVDLITVTGIDDWTPYVGKRIRVTSGARQHYVLMVGEANPDGLGNNIARVTQLDKAFASYQILQVGDAVAVEELVAVSKYALTVRRPARWDATTDGSYYHLIVQSLSMDAGTGVPLNLQAPGAVRYSQPLFFGCILRPRGAIEGCALWSCCVLLDGAIYLKGGNGVIFATCLFLGISGTPSIYMTDLCAIQYSVVQGAGMQAGRGHSSIYGPGTGIFDAPGTAILIDHNSRLEFRNGVCLGKGNVGFGLYLGHGDCVANYSGYKPIVTGAAGDWCQPDAVAKIWDDAPEFSTVYASGIVGG